MPDPMHALNRHPAPDGVCYTFGERGKKRSAISQRMANIEWSTAQCRDAAPRLHDADALLHDEISCEPVNQTGCPGSSPRRHLAPRPGFGFCDRALGGRGAGKEGGKISPGTLALTSIVELPSSAKASDELSTKTRRIDSMSSRRKSRAATPRS